MQNDTVRVVNHVRRNISDVRLNAATSDYAYPYAAVPICMIDAVFSLGVRFEGVWNLVCRWCEKYGWEMCRWRAAETRTTSDFLDILRPYEGRFDAMAKEVFNSQWRTSPRGGILKAEAVYRFAKRLQAFDIETFQDALERGRAGRVRSAIEDIPGQSSGLSYNYFLMLVGDHAAVKADRMIRGFVSDALSVPAVESRRAEEAVRAAAIALRAEFPDLTPSRLDNAIWEFQRTKSTKGVEERRHETLAWVEAAKECARYKPG